MDERSKLEHVPPLGKSVEDVERESGNLHNSDEPREEVRAREDEMPPAPFAGPTRAMAMRGTMSPDLHSTDGTDTVRDDEGRGEDPTDNQT